jgi:hypothetical protein
MRLPPSRANLSDWFRSPNDSCPNIDVVLNRQHGLQATAPIACSPPFSNSNRNSEIEDRAGIAAVWS